MKPEVKKSQSVKVRMKYPTVPTERKEKPTTPGAVEEKGREEKGDKVAEVEEKKPEIKPKEEGKPQIAIVEEPKGRAIPEWKLPPGRYTVNVGSFRKSIRAERLMNELKKKGYKTFVTEATIPQKGTWYRVSLGRFPTRGEAQAFARALKKKEGIDSFVRELKEAKR